MKVKDRVVIVHLRKPRLNNPHDSRKDPFWEFGSFGLTGCHSRNILSFGRANGLNGVRLAFAQGGNGVMKLVYLSPPIIVRIHVNKVEACWNPSMPFVFDTAPVIINNSGKTLFPELKKTFSRINRDTWVRKFSSMYRSRNTELSDVVTRELINVFDSHYKSFRLATTYEQALPFLPSRVDQNRLQTYKNLLDKAKGSNHNNYSTKTTA